MSNLFDEPIDSDAWDNQDPDLYNDPQDGTEADYMCKTGRCGDCIACDEQADYDYDMEKGA